MPQLRFLFKKQLEKYVSFVRFQDSFVSELVRVHKATFDQDDTNKNILDRFLNADLPTRQWS